MRPRVRRGPIVPLAAGRPVRPLRGRSAKAAGHSAGTTSHPSGRLRESATQRATATEGTARASRAADERQRPQYDESVGESVIEASAMRAAQAGVWDPDVSHEALPPALLSEERPPLQHEARRVEALRRLRLAFSDATKSLNKPSELVGVFERWHFGCLYEARSGTRSNDASVDVLIPNAKAPNADAAFIKELHNVGLEKEKSLTLLEQLRQQSANDAAALLSGAGVDMEDRDGTLCKGGKVKAPPSLTHDAVEVVDIEPAPNGKGVLMVRWSSQGKGELPLKINCDHFEKLRQMHSRVVDASACQLSLEGREGLFRRDLVRLLLRYKALGGSGFQAALGGAAHAALRASFSCGFECFASPLNARSVPFCSGFLDVDAPFGSIGSFFDFRPQQGSFEANPPFVPALVSAMTEHMRSLLDAAEQRNAPLLFATIVGASAGMRRSDAWAALLSLAASPYGRAHWAIPLHRHGFTEGHAHITPRGECVRMSSCESAVFIFATSAAAEAFPSTSEKEAAVRAGLRLSIPTKLHKASKANKLAHLQKKKRRREAGLTASS